MEPLAAIEFLPKTPLSNSSHHISQSEQKDVVVAPDVNKNIDNFVASCFSGKAYQTDIETTLNTKQDSSDDN